MSKNGLKFLISKTEENQIFLVKVASILIAFAALLTASYFPRLFGVIIFSYMPMIVGTSVPILAALFMKSPSLHAAITSSIFGVGSWAIFFFAARNIGVDTDTAHYAAAIVGWCFSASTFGIAELIARAWKTMQLSQ